MSKGNSAIKVVRTALKRVQKGWRKSAWSERNPDTGIFEVCMEGALFGYCNLHETQLTPAQLKARDTVWEIIRERFSERVISRIYEDPTDEEKEKVLAEPRIPTFNDAPDTVFEEVEEIFKLALIRLETEDLMKDYLDEDELDEVQSLL